MFPVYLSRRCCKMQITYIVHFMFKLVWMENFADRLHRVFLVFFWILFQHKIPQTACIKLACMIFFLRANLTRRVVQTHCVQIFAWCFTFTASLFQQKIWQAHFKKTTLYFCCQTISMKKMQKHCIKRPCVFLQDQNWQQQSKT